MKIKYYLLLFVFLLHFSFCIAHTPSGKEAKFKQTVNAVITAFSRQDSVAINKLIHKKTGLVLLFRQGAFDNFEQLKTISFNDETFPQVMFQNPKEIKLLTLQYGKLPKYSCDKEGWSKKGLFIDTSKTDHILSSICKARNKYVPDDIPAKKIKSYYNLELKSRRVVLVSKQNLELVFYLTYIEGRWYLSIFDNVSSDCSA